MKISVLISRAYHPSSGRSVPSHLDLKACSLALNIKQPGIDVDFIHFGDYSKVIKDYLGYGLGRVDCYSADEHFDTSDVADKLKDADLLITGRKAMSGFASGLFGYQLANVLQRPLHSNMVTLEYQEGTLKAEQYLPSGYRRAIDLHLPAVISVHESAPCTLNFSYLDQGSGDVMVHSDMRFTTDKPHNYMWTIKQARRLRKRLKVSSDGDIGGDDRMRQAIAIGTAGGGSIHRLSATESAESIWNILQERKLVG